MFLSPDTERGRVVIPNFLGRLMLVSCGQGSLFLQGSAGLQEPLCSSNTPGLDCEVPGALICPEKFL